MNDIENCKKKKKKKKFFGVYWSEKRNHSLIFKVLKSIYIFESTNRFTDEHVSTSYCVVFSLVVSLTKCINSCSQS